MWNALALASIVATLLSRINTQLISLLFATLKFRSEFLLHLHADETFGELRPGGRKD